MDVRVLQAQTIPVSPRRAVHRNGSPRWASTDTIGLFSEAADSLTPTVLARAMVAGDCHRPVSGCVRI